MRHFEIHRVMTEQLFNAPKAIETLASGTMKVYGLGKGLDRRNDMARAQFCEFQIGSRFKDWYKSKWDPNNLKSV